MEKCNSNYYGLIFKCPVDKALDKCVYNKLRLLPSKERINYYNALTEVEKMILIDEHQRCLSVREKKNIL